MAHPLSVKVVIRFSAKTTSILKTLKVVPKTLESNCHASFIIPHPISNLHANFKRFIYISDSYTTLHALDWSDNMNNHGAGCK